MAPVTILHGHCKLYVNDIAALPQVLASLSPQVQPTDRTHVDAVAALAQANRLLLDAAGSAFGKKVRSLRDVIFWCRACANSGDLRFLKELHFAYSLLRHVSDNDILERSQTFCDQLLDTKATMTTDMDSPSTANTPAMSKDKDGRRPLTPKVKARSVSSCFSSDAGRDNVLNAEPDMKHKNNDSQVLDIFDDSVEAGVQTIDCCYKPNGPKDQPGVDVCVGSNLVLFPLAESCVQTAEDCVTNEIQTDINLDTFNMTELTLCRANEAFQEIQNQQNIMKQDFDTKAAELNTQIAALSSALNAKEVNSKVNSKRTGR
eukprot:TRINITY_DN23173_c0_g1_i3.p2 TRINITY_DN23173_c0_g1~~TRINITY_DN23173_c0_g1_i3.p2  ORF type:complete len:317 (-),score=66.38 TRINITY_DN23173_c0_g1_i3:83-1033(-)